MSDMKVSNLINWLASFKSQYGNLLVTTVIPEGPYARCEGEPEILGIGYQDAEGNYLTLDEYNEMVRDNSLEAVQESGVNGPYLCIGANAYE